MVTKTENIHFFDTMTREKKRFKPLHGSKVQMYTCGPTVYDFAHIGNFRSFVFEDLLRRWLKYRGFQVIQVMNITDVDDRTIAASKKQGISLNEHTKKYIDAFFEDISALRLEGAEHYPRATDNIPEMVCLIQKLIEKGYAYKSEDGSIYYDISQFKDYGKLSKFEIQQLRAGARVKVDEYDKAEARDFALWKAWTEDDGDVFWETEIGKGRPGWHIECSAMSMKYLGKTLDIHTGGVDNMFPHHENEIAQSEAATGKKFVNYWLHCEHLLVNGKRMAKRYGNYYTLRDLVRRGYDPVAVRYLLLSTHYRQQFNFTFKGLNAARNAIDRLRSFARRLLYVTGQNSKGRMTKLIDRVQQDFCKAMDDDLNVGLALAALFRFVREANNIIDVNGLDKKEAKKAYDLVSGFDKVLGVIGKIEKEEELPKEAKELILKREEARKAKDWKTADKIRKQLEDLGVALEDTSQGVEWQVKER